MGGRGTKQTSMNSLWQQLAERLIDFALLDYVSKFWMDHLRLCNLTTLDDDMIARLSWFLQWKEHRHNYAIWQQVYHGHPTMYSVGRNPLFYAIGFKIDCLMSLFLSSEGLIKEQDEGETALHVAARFGALRTARELVKRGADVNVANEEYRFLTPLHNAAEGGHAEMIKFLLENGAFIHARSDTKTTPFYRAARSGAIQALKILYDAGMSSF